MSTELIYRERCALLAQIAAATVVAMGVLVLLGWYFDAQSLKGGLAAGIRVKTNTAIEFVLAGAAFLVLHRCSPLDRVSQTIVRGLATLIFAIAAATLFQHLTQINLGIDELIFTEPRGEAATYSPNRMGPPASLNFILVSFGLLLLARPTPRRCNIASNLFVAVGVLSLVSTLGFLFGAVELYGIARFTGISMSTALAFLLLSLCGICSSTDSALLRMLVAPDAGGILARRLLPPAVLLPPLLGYLRTVGAEWGLYDPAFGRALLVVAFVLIFARLVWASAKVLQSVDSARLDLFERERAARSNAERANRTKDEFLAVVSHELRTPLNAILGWSQILQRKVTPESEQAKGLQVIERNSKLQAQLIEDLLDMSRTLAGKMHLQFASLNLCSAVNESLAAVRQEASDKRISIREEYCAAPIQVWADRDRLKQIFWNILSNALKFTPPGGEIFVGVSTESGMGVVTVRDSGIGIEAPFMERMFDRFSQADSSTTRSHNGLGIGLSVVRELVHLHKGQISAYSAGRDTGTEFTVRIPLSGEREVAIAKEPLSAHHPACRPDHFQSFEMLVVDDDEDSRALTGKVLEEYGARVTLASSAEEAMSILESCKVQLLIADIGMPRIDGYELLRRVRAVHGESLRAIALTAFDRSADKERAREAGFHAHVVKPLNTAELVATVAKLLA